MDSIARGLIIFGIILIVAGLAWHLTGGKIPLGKLPGDIRIQTENSRIFFPITTSIVLSIILSLTAWFFRK